MKTLTTSATARSVAESEDYGHEEGELESESTARCRAHRITSPEHRPVSEIAADTSFPVAEAEECLGCRVMRYQILEAVVVDVLDVPTAAVGR